MAKKISKGNGKAKTTEFDKVFNKTVEYWNNISGDISCELADAIGALSLIDEMSDNVPEEFYNLVHQARVVGKALGELKKKAETLSDSISSVGIIKPIDELEAKVIAAIRTTESPGTYRPDVHRALAPLFKLAKEKDEGFSLPEWVKGYVHFKDLKEQAKKEAS